MMEYPEYKHSFKNLFRTMASLTVYRTGQQQCPPGFSRGEEVRDFYLIHFVTKGCGMFWLNGKAFPVKAHQCFLIYPQMPIDYRADEQNPWEYCWVGFNGNDARILLNATAFSTQMPVIDVEDWQTVWQLLMDIYTVRGSEPHQIIAMTANLYKLLSFLMKEAARDTLLPHSGAVHVQHACDYIAMHYAEPISVEEVAAYVGICRSHLFRLFREHLQITPQQYLIEFRIRQACNLLAHKKMLVKEAAFAVGMNDPLYFSTVFKRLIGCTPKEYETHLRTHTIEMLNNQPLHTAQAPMSDA